MLSRIVDDKRRTAVFARYSLVGSLVAALGSLAAALPGLATGVLGVTTAGAIQGMFVLYALLAGLSALVYRGLPSALSADAQEPTAPLTNWRIVFEWQDGEAERVRQEDYHGK